MSPHINPFRISENGIIVGKRAGEGRKEGEMVKEALGKRFVKDPEEVMTVVMNRPLKGIIYINKSGIQKLSHEK